MMLAPEYKGCAVSSKVVLGLACLFAILMPVAMLYTHHWVLHSMPNYSKGVGFWNWLDLATSSFGILVCAEWFTFATCKSDRTFFLLLTSFLLTDIIRHLAIFPWTRAAVLSTYRHYPEILYAIGIIRWIIGIAIFAVIVDHLLRLRKAHSTEVEA
jgi:hypothetical protein